jgi:glutathione synthase/RimK-type ligase-like ATP-grasp enzyme
VDWRREALRLAGRWRPTQLPERTERGLLSLARRLGLAHGSADLLEDAYGRLWFLELNPAGEWLWLEEGAGLDISGALADALLSGVGDPG